MLPSVTVDKQCIIFLHQTSPRLHCVCSMWTHSRSGPSVDLSKNNDTQATVALNPKCK